MATERQRLLELALESLENKRNQIDSEIAELTLELRGRSARKARRTGVKDKDFANTTFRRRVLSKQERLRRSRRMKAYWENWRKQRGRAK